MLSHLTVAQNIFIGREMMNGKLINDSKMNQEEEAVRSAEHRYRPYGKDGEPYGRKEQMCEIAKAISHDAKVIIFDEPSSSADGKRRSRNCSKLSGT